MFFDRLRPGPWISGALGGVIVMFILITVTVPFWPDYPMLKTGARILENPMPQLLICCLISLFILWFLRTPRFVIWGSAVLWAAAVGLFLQGHLARAQALEPQARPEVTVLWFNMLFNNQTPTEDLVRALGESPADVIFLGEPIPLAADLPALDDWFPVRAGCGPQTRCEFIALARDPEAEITMIPIGRTHEQRLAVMRIPGPEGQVATLVGVHLFKPWFYGIIESEEWFTLTALAELSGPLVMVGDLNATPWSRRGRMFADLCDLAPLRTPLPTWPAKAGWLGLPIDTVLTRDVEVVSLKMWGQGLGSNHMGLLAELSFAGSDWDADRPPLCRPEWSPGDETPLMAARRIAAEKKAAK